MMSKKLIGILIALCLFFAASALAEGDGVSRYASILDEWNAKDGKELRLRILEYWEEESNYGRNWPLNIRLGGTTNELINAPESWDLAIVSSKDVDLQMLANEGLIMSSGNTPFMEVALHQWLWPQQLLEKLPVDPILMYDVYCYDYDAEKDEATLLICQENIGRKRNNPRVPSTFAQEILKKRSVDQVRALEGIYRVNNMTMDGIAEWNPDDLIQRPKDWDVATLLLHDESELESLDQAGLLYDFSSNPYWLERKMDWPVPNAIFSSDERLIAIPYKPFLATEPGTFRVIVINKQAPDILRALDYSQHFVKSFEWVYSFNEANQPEEIQKYGICIYKDEVDW